MTDDLTPAAVDERGLRAGATRVALAAALPVPVFDPDLVDGRVVRVGRRRRWVAAAGAVAAVALIVGAAAVLASRGEDDSAPTVDAERGPRPAAYVLDQPPAGLGLASVSEPRTGPDPLRGGPGDLDPHGPTTTLYGPGPDGPPGLAAVAVRAWAGGGTSPGPAGGGPVPTEAAGLEPVAVVGRDRAWATPASAPGPPSVLVAVGEGFVQVYRTDDAGSTATVDAVLLAAAGAVAVADERATIAAAGLPAGWGELGDVATSAVVDDDLVAPAPFGAAEAWSTTHGTVPEAESGPVVPPDTERRGLVITVVPGDALDVQARRFGAATHVEVQVRGHPAVLVLRPARAERPWEQLSLSWIEAPGVLVEVVGVGLDRDELLPLAEGIRPATSEDVDQARGAQLDDQLAMFAADGVVLLGRGRFSGGREWGLVAYGGDGARESAELVVPGPPGSWACGLRDGAPDLDQPDAPAVGETCRGTTGDLAAAYGRVRDDVAEIALVGLDEPDAEGASTEVARVPVLAAGGVAGFAVELPDEDHGYRVVAYADDGEEIGSARLGV